MIRGVLTLLLTASLAACPLRCASLSAGCTDVTALAVVDCDDCCNPVHGSRSAECPDDGCPEDDCRCDSCICGGALQEDDAANDSVTQLLLVDLVTITHGSSALQSAFVSQTGRIGDGSLHVSGREARIAHQSLLI